MSETPRVKAVVAKKSAEDPTLFFVTIAIGEGLPVSVIMSREIAAAFAEALVRLLA